MSERQKGDEGVKDVIHLAAYLRLSHEQFRGWDQPRGGTCQGKKRWGKAVLKSRCS